MVKTLFKGLRWALTVLSETRESTAQLGGTFSSIMVKKNAEYILFCVTLIDCPAEIYKSMCEHKEFAT